MKLETVTLVRILGVALGVVGLVVCWRLARLHRREVAVPAAKRLAFLGLFAIPVAAVGVANYHVFEGTKEVGGCMACHVMKPMGTDMLDPHSDTLAARHFKNRWIAEHQCYHCHADYGLNGTLEAKMEGYRHLARYTTQTYREPIEARVVFKNKNCLNCHADTPLFERVSSHQTVREQLDSNAMSCLNCHGRAHPTREQRTPGSAEYERLLGKETR